MPFGCLPTCFGIKGNLSVPLFLPLGILGTQASVFSPSLPRALRWVIRLKEGLPGKLLSLKESLSRSMLKKCF